MTVVSAVNPEITDAPTPRRWAPRGSRALPGEPRPLMRMDVLVSGNAAWASNDLRFYDQNEALAFARGLCDRWTIVDKIRIVPEGWARQETYVIGSEHPEWVGVRVNVAGAGHSVGPHSQAAHRHEQLGG